MSKHNKKKCITIKYNTEKVQHKKENTLIKRADTTQKYYIMHKNTTHKNTTQKYKIKKKENTTQNNSKHYFLSFFSLILD